MQRFNIANYADDARPVDSSKLPETPETTEMKENFTKATKYLTKFKETLIN